MRLAARTRDVVRTAALVVLALCPAERALAQLNEHCTVSVLNRTVQVNPDGSWVLPNVPAGTGQVKARATCIENGVTRSGESDFFTIVPNRMNAIPQIRFGAITQVPTSVAVTPGTATLTSIGETLQLTVTATYPTGSPTNVSAAGSGTNYTTSNAAIASITADGLVTAVASGTVVVQATNDGTPGMATIRVVPAGATTDTDGDLIPDDAELRLGLDPNNPVDAQEDQDRDGLTALAEYGAGTDPLDADTDNDGLVDGVELSGSNGFFTSPLLFDTDGDGVSDGLEVTTGSNPTDGTSTNLGAALESLSITPAIFGINFNTIAGDAFQQLNVTGRLLDGTTLDLTAGRGVNYGSSDITICNFGGVEGRVFAGVDGACTITAALASFTGTASGTVRAFSPIPLSFVEIPGFANSVDVNGSYAFVAAGDQGLQVVDVSNRMNPAIVGSLALPGNANDVKLAGTRAYIAGGGAGLHIVDVTDPVTPVRVRSIDTPGDAVDVRVYGNLAYVADGNGGLQIIDITDSNPGIVGSLTTGDHVNGVDVSGAVAVLTSSNLLIVDVSAPQSPTVVGSVDDLPAQPQDVVVNGSIAYVADYDGSLQVVDFATPSAPRIVGSTAGDLSTGGVLVDLAVSAPFVFGADIFFVNGVPIVDASTPANPRPRAILDFSNFRDDNATGIAVDGNYVYMTAAGGDTRLYIGQYLAVEDLNGVPPTVALTSPAAGATFLEGETIPLSATARDDVAVSLVNFTVDGVVVFTDTSAPYQFNLTAPSGVTSLTIGAAAADLGGNVGTAETIRVNIIPDPLTTVVGRVIDSIQQPVAGAAVTVAGRTVTTNVDGSFSIPGVPTVQRALTVHVSLTRDNVTLIGTSAPTPPVRGGTTDVGDIVAAETAFENDLGIRVPRCTWCDITVDLPFAFPIDGIPRQTVHINNGYLWTDQGDTLEPLCCIFNGDGGGGGEALAAAAASDPASGVYINDQLPGRFVVTWFAQDSDVGGPNTVQLILFADGRIQYGYKAIVPGQYVEVGLFLANSTLSTEVDFSAGPLTTAAGEDVYEDFDPDDRPFDLVGGFVVFTPAAGGGGGYQIRPVPDTTAPVCVVTNPIDGATLFEGESLHIEANATDNGVIKRVTFQSTAGGLNVDDLTSPFGVPFIVPVGASQITFNVTAYDSWNNSGACAATVNVIRGPAPTTTVIVPGAGGAVTAGSTIPISIDATNRVPVSRVDLTVNGVVLATDTVAPFEFAFTVPAGVTTLALGASAVNTVGQEGSSPAVDLMVVPDPLTTIEGRVVRSETPVNGAQLTTDLHGVSVETFAFSPPEGEWPPNLTNRTPDRVTVASAINLRNPGGMFGADAFGLGAGNHVNRLTARLETVAAGTVYTFTLGVNQRGLLKVNGTTVVDIPVGTGQFQQASGPFEVPPGDGSVAIEILTVDNGNPEVQLSYALEDGEPEIAVLDELTPTIVPYQATSGTDGTFSMPGVPTVLGDFVVRASAEIDGRTARGRSAATAPVAGAATNVGDIAIRAGGRIGYYDLNFNAGAPSQAPPITTAGLQPFDVGDLNTADLSQYDVLFVQNPSNGGFFGAFATNLAKVHQFVNDGGVLVLHDRAVSAAATVLPGAPGTILRDFSDEANVNVVDDTTLVTNGPGGVIDNASLDGGSSSSHGYILASTIPAGARGILSTGDPTHLVLYTYPFGLGHVVYSTIPLDHYLAGSGSANVNVNMQRYAANVVAFANDQR